MIILSDVEYSNSLLENGPCNKKPEKDIFILSKFYKYKMGLDNEQIKAKILSWLDAYIHNYNKKYYDDVIDNILKNIDSYKLKDPQCFDINKTELLWINASSDDIRIKKVLFTLLCLSKILPVGNDGKHWINLSLNSIYELANVFAYSGDKRYKNGYYEIMKTLIDNNYIVMSKKISNLSFYLNIPDPDHSKVEIKISRFSNFGKTYEVYYYKNKKICNNCGKLFTTNNKKIKYCSDDCKRISKNKQNARWYARKSDVDTERI